MKTLCTLILLFITFLGQAQGILDDPNAIFISPEGKTLSTKQAAKMLYSAQRYRLDKDTEKVPGKVLVTLVPISDKEFEKMIEADQKSVKALKGSKMKPFTLPDLAENNINSKSLSGKLVVYNFWFTGCRPCIEELPQLNELVGKYKEKVTFIAPTFNDKEQVERFLKKREFKYQILTDATDLAKEMNITSYPTHLVVDEEGVIRKVFIGATDSIGKKLESAINSL